MKKTLKQLAALALSATLIFSAIIVPGAFGAFDNEEIPVIRPLWDEDIPDVNRN